MYKRDTAAQCDSVRAVSRSSSHVEYLLIPCDLPVLDLAEKGFRRIRAPFRMPSYPNEEQQVYLY